MAKKPKDLFENAVPFRFRVSLVREPVAHYGDPPAISQPDRAAQYLWRTVFHDLDRETMAAAYLDIRNRLIGVNVAYVGTINRTAIEPRGLLVPGLLCNAAGVLIAHNHPSGDPSPSAEDILLTRRVAEAGEVVGIRLVDHLILGDEGRWVSLKNRGCW